MSAHTTKRARPGVVARRGSAPPRVQVSEMQRSRLLAAAAAAVDEEGYTRTTVARITARARVSRRTFYELFDDREACLDALIEDVVATIEGEIARANLAGLTWRERVRGGLLAILAFFDREPALARVCLVQSLRGGPTVLKRRERILARLVAVLDGGRSERGTKGEGGVTELTAEGLIGAALAIVHTRVQRGPNSPPLTSLTGELMSMIVLPYLGAAAARREQGRPAPTPASDAGKERSAAGQTNGDPLAGVPMRLTYRTALVLGCIAQEPGASNRVIGDHAGISDQGQISKLLARLERLGLAANTGDGHLKGERNAWRLTPKGVKVEHSIRAHTHDNGSTT
jgi:AcrR family transcriptional regulator/DNA-binding MarR family transcriptional regulator